MKLDAPGLENALVRLDLFGPEHHDALRRSGAIDYMWKWMPAIPRGVNFDAYTDHVAQMREAGKLIPFAVVRKSDNAFAGVVAYGLVDRLHRRVRISFAWHPRDMRGTLVFPATQGALIERALKWGARRIAWTVDVRNEAALAAFERLGAQREGVLRSFMRMTDGTWADHWTLSMLRSEAEGAVRRIGARIEADLAGGEGPPA